MRFKLVNCFFENKMDDLPFNLVLLSREKLMSDLYPDYDVPFRQVFFEDILSDNDSLHDIATPDDEDFIDYNNLLVGLGEEESDAEDNVPLSEVRKLLLKAQGKKMFYPPT